MRWQQSAYVGDFLGEFRNFRRVSARETGLDPLPGDLRHSPRGLSQAFCLWRFGFVSQLQTGPLFVRHGALARGDLSLSGTQLAWSGIGHAATPNTLGCMASAGLDCVGDRPVSTLSRPLPGPIAVFQDACWLACSDVKRRVRPLRVEANLELFAFEFVGRLPKLARHLEDMIRYDHGKRGTALFIPASNTRTTDFQGCVEDMEVRRKSFVRDHSTELDSWLLLDQTKFEHNVSTRRQYSAAVVPYQTQQPFFSLNIPRHKIAARAVWAEQRRKPLVERDVHAVAACSQSRAEGGFSSPYRALDQMNLRHA